MAEEFINHYHCSVCDHTWSDRWSCTCDDRCPKCNTSTSPTFSEDVVEDEAEPQEETEEEHAVRLRRISDEVKADMKAGRYRHGQLNPKISAKTEKKDPWEFGLQDYQKDILRAMMYGRSSPSMFTEMYMGKFESPGRGKSEMIIYDEFFDFPKKEQPLTDVLDSGPKKPYWTQPIPDSKIPKPISSPSEELRAKRRAKRKKRK